MIIEQATVEDAVMILNLQKLAYQDEAAIYDDYAIPPLTQTLGQIRADFGTRLFLKAEINEQIVGSVRAYIEQGTCFVGRLVVHPDHRSHGIGTALMAAIEERFAEAQRYELFTGSKSKRNLYLYQKLGYRPFRFQRVSDKLTLVFLEKPGT
jgi:GNAT superfamily N-acetyltransferase